jgi:crotonobetainyl-CoA:carnitine CoA-transferase CaiB-like acyl-CoA transferase
MAGALEGFRIVDATQMIAGPVAARILGDQGADVIKVEPPEGDLVRGLGGAHRGLAPIFATTNRNKRSVVLDLRKPVGVLALQRLVASADVFMQNFRPGKAERMGIGEAALRAARPDLVYVSISGFGERGPYAGKRVYDPVIQALSGLASIQGGSSGRPRMMRLIVPDKVTALTAAQAITAALLARERTGRGQHVRLAMLDAVIAFLWPEGMARHTYTGSDLSGTRPPDVRDLVFETADGFMTAGTVALREWQAFCAAVGRDDWARDPRFRSAAGLVKHADARLERMAEVLRTRPTDEWLAILDAAEVPCAPILTREALLEHPQVLANEIVRESEHPHAGPMREARPPERLDGTPSGVRRPAPLLGEHTVEVLREVGFGTEEIAALRRDGAILESPAPVRGA